MEISSSINVSDRRSTLDTDEDSIFVDSKISPRSPPEELLFSVLVIEMKIINYRIYLYKKHQKNKQNILFILLLINEDYFNQSGSSSSIAEITGHSDTTGVGFFFFGFGKIISSSFFPVFSSTLSGFCRFFFEGIFISSTTSISFSETTSKGIASFCFLATFLEALSVSTVAGTGPFSQSGISSYGTVSFSHSVLFIITGSSGIISCFGIVSVIISSADITGVSDSVHLSQSGILSSPAILGVFMGSNISSSTSCFKDFSSIPFIHGGKSAMVSSEVVSDSIGIVSSSGTL